MYIFFFFQAEDGIRDIGVTGVQTCAVPIYINLKLSYIKCKGAKDKERIIPIGSYAVNCLNEYLKVRDKMNADNSELLFCNLRGGKMTRQGFWKIVKKYAKDANINKKIDS